MILDISKAEVDYYERRITSAQLDSIIKEASTGINDIEISWKYDIANDSLRKLSKYDYHWYKVYTVQVKMRSGDIKKPRVVMCPDGITPLCIEKDVETEIRDNVAQMINIVRNIVYYY